MNRNHLFAVRTPDLLLFILILSAFQFLSPSRVMAHPHVFVDCQLTFIFNDKGLEGFRQDWIFDEMFGAMVLGEHDLNRDQKISAEEQKSIYNGAFINLKNFDYFTHINIDGKNVEVNEARDFKTFVKEGFLHYDFFIPCKIDFDGKKHSMLTSIYDKSYYTAIFLSNDNKLKGAPEGNKVTLAFDTIEELSYYQGQVVPEGAVLTLNP